ncbi:MAG: polyisoprenoid-binding protein [Vitreoscilla sp.]|nr:polyisoprenoid-binding protein [Burkholderiales bacterium]MBP6336310.1 polyisoprenoid-binding protein [Vitreoscilla sp.]MBP6674121.1 polyisoprenoid-binding protein [Vitreoscilla sp.]
MPFNPRPWLATLLCGGMAHAAPVTYEIEPGHTYPSFEADHMGLSVWRGKFTKSAGQIVYDKATGLGAVDLVVHTDSVDYGLAQMNAVAKGESLFDVEKFPYARYTGQLAGVVNGVPTQVVGELSLRGKTRPVTLAILKFKCMPHPLFKRELCGADALATINREEFGIDAGKAYGFDMAVTLRIQVEAIAKE